MLANHSSTLFLLLFLILGTSAAPAKSQSPQPSRQTRPLASPPLPQVRRIISPQVNADRTITFRFRDPNAGNVSVSLEGDAQPLPMQKDENGVWSGTSEPLAPNIYGYSFVADGVRLMDPSNSLIKPNLLNPQSMAVVPGQSPEPWEITDVPHGVVHHIFYHSGVVGDNRDFYVYTPPGYDPRGRKKYPALYLLHGYSDDASAWTAAGRANIIFDNLIAQGKVTPMIVVMPLGYGAPRILGRLGRGPATQNLVTQNITKFRDALLTEVLPQVERDFRVKTDRDDRAITGLSMGGGESLYVGLNDLDRFAWVGAFSAGLGERSLDAEFPLSAGKINSQLRLLWIACGEQDPVVGRFNRALRAWLNSKGIRYVNIQTPGMHTWMVWRNNLVAFAPLLFRKTQ
jgi:enterochelin esterase-like enzyme